MKKFLPFLFLSVGIFAVVGVLFLLVRTDALPESLKSIARRKGTGVPVDAPVEEPIA